MLTRLKNTAVLHTLNFVTRWLLVALTMCLVLVAFPAFAQDGGMDGLPADVDFAVFAADPLNPELLGRLVLNAIVNKNWALLAALLSAGLIAGLRKWIPGHTVVGKWFLTRVGTLVTNFLLQLAVIFTALFLGGGTFNLSLVLKALTMAFTTSGIWSTFKAVKETINENKASDAGKPNDGGPTPGATVDA